MPDPSEIFYLGMIGNALKHAQNMVTSCSIDGAERPIIFLEPLIRSTRAELRSAHTFLESLSAETKISLPKEIDAALDHPTVAALESHTESAIRAHRIATARLTADSLDADTLGDLYVELARAEAIATGVLKGLEVDPGRGTSGKRGF